MTIGTTAPSRGLVEGEGETMTTRTLSGTVISTDVTPLVELGVTALRIVVGLLVATLHGWHKLIDGGRYVTSGAEWSLLHDTEQLGLPLPVLFTMAAALSQFVGGCLLTVGAGTRVAAFFIAATMTTAMWFNIQTSGPDAQLAGLYALVSGAFVLMGGGRWSLDRTWSRT